MSPDEDLEGRLHGSLPPPAGLDRDRQWEWESRRARIRRHHAAWRASMPALGEIFDDPEHRGRALAGNLARELGASLEAGVELAGQAGAEGWIREASEAWSEAVREWLAGSCEPELADRTEGYLAEFVARERTRLAARLAEGREPPRNPGGLARVWLAIRQGWGRIFWPGA